MENTMDVTKIKLPKKVLWNNNTSWSIVISWYNDIILEEILEWPMTWHFFVESNGDIHWTALLSQVVNHCPHTYGRFSNMNESSIGIIIQKRNWKITKDSKEWVKKVVRYLTQKLGILEERIFKIDDISWEKQLSNSLEWWYDSRADYVHYIHYNSHHLDDVVKLKKKTKEKKDIDMITQLKGIWIINFEDTDDIDPRVISMIYNLSRYAKNLPIR